MAKFLNETGLSYFWGKVKDFIKSKYVAIGNTITVNDSNGNTTTIDGTVYVEGEDAHENVNIDHSSITIHSLDESSNDLETTIMSEGIVTTAGDYTASFNAGQIGFQKGDDGSIIQPGLITTSENGSIKVGNVSSMDKSQVKAPKFVKSGGTNVQVLLADGSIATLNAANGIPKLDANGRIPLSQLGNLDTTLFQVVTALPTSNIKSNRIYLLKTSTSGTQNIYAEYIYTGNVSATYDSTKWEKLGEYKADIDLTPYSKKTETVSSVRSLQNNSNNVVLQTPTAAGNALTTTINAATQSVAGVMTGADKKALDTLTARYPLSIASFTVSPSLVEVGTNTVNLKYSWSLNNTDFHSVTVQKVGDSTLFSDTTVANGTLTYTATVDGIGGSKFKEADAYPATLTINGSLKKTVNVTAHYPSYIGVVANGTSITETVVKGLAKSIEWGKGKTATLTQSNQLIVYAYPASYGDLTSIKDGNGFEGFAGYTKTTLTVGGQTYNVYTQKLPATASSKYTFA